MPEKSWIQISRDLRERKKKDRNAKEPCRRGNDRSPPRQMNQTSTCVFQCVRGNGIAVAQLLQNWSQGKERPQPECNASGISNRVVENDSFEKTIAQRAVAKQRINDDGVVPNVENTSEQLWDERRQRDPKKCVTSVLMLGFNAASMVENNRVE